MKIKDIAELANVSKTTVSMVLNNKPGISEHTRNTVMDLADRYGYKIPNSRNAVEQKGNGNIRLTVYRKHGKVLKDTPFFQSLIEGIESKARHNNYQLTIKYISENMQDITQVASELNENMIDGMILLATEIDEKILKDFLKLQMPVIVLDSYFLGLTANYVVINNASGMYRSVNYLLSNGHKEIGYLKSYVDIPNFQERYNAYVKVLECNNISSNKHYTITLGTTIEDAYADMLSFLNKKPLLPTAFVADNDLVAIGAMKALKEYGVDIPGDVSIVGFDDMPFCTVVEPTLTTIGVDKNIFGRLAVESLINAINSPGKYYSKQSLDVELIERDSVRKL